MTGQSLHEDLAPATVDTRRVVIVAAAVLLFLGASMGVLAFAFFSIAPNVRSPGPREFPAPQLQAHPSADLQQYIANQRAQLSGYRWANSDHTVVAIPIERAMGIIVQRGADGYQPVGSVRPAEAPAGAKP